MAKKTELETKPWYRFVKVLYILLYVGALSVVFLIVWSMSKPYTWVDNYKATITCNYGNRKTFTIRKTDGFSFIGNSEIESFGEKNRDSILDTCGISKNNTLPRDTKLYDIALYTETTGSWSEFYKNLIFGIFGVVLVLELIKRAFLYVVTGSATPEKQARTSDKSNYRK